jgi:hypothetical protein
VIVESERRKYNVTPAYKASMLIGLMSMLCDLATGTEADYDYDEMVTACQVVGLDPHELLFENNVMIALQKVSVEYTKMDIDVVLKEMLGRDEAVNTTT